MSQPPFAGEPIAGPDRPPAPNLSQRVLHEVGPAVPLVERRPAVPRAAQVTPNRHLAVGGRARCGVPQIRVMEEHVASLEVEGDLSGYSFESERDPFGA